ncbi:Arylsulfatase B, partial [Armadillidium vulgare]
MADDLGWNDLGFHGNNVICTPNIDALAYSGVILNNYYVQPACTPSRSAFLTGMYPIHTGTYATDILTDESVRIINEHDPSKPLFLYFAQLALHIGNPGARFQAPKEVIQRFSYIEDEKEESSAAMLWKLDESVGRVTKALQDNNMLDNSIIVFTNDNGGGSGEQQGSASTN